MMTAMSQQPLTVLDPDLPFLAAKAAVQLDNLLLRRGTDLSAVVALASRLSNSQFSPIASGQHNQLVDFATLSVLSQAIHGVSGSSITTLDDLSQQAAKLTDELRLSSTSQEQPDNVVKKVRMFCSLLSQCATAFQHSLHENSSDWPSRN